MQVKYGYLVGGLKLKIIIKSCYMTRWTAGAAGKSITWFGGRRTMRLFVCSLLLVVSSFSRRMGFFLN